MFWWLTQSNVGKCRKSKLSHVKGSIRHCLRSVVMKTVSAEGFALSGCVGKNVTLKASSFNKSQELSMNGPQQVQYQSLTSNEIQQVSIRLWNLVRDQVLPRCSWRKSCRSITQNSRMLKLLNPGDLTITKSTTVPVRKHDGFKISLKINSLGSTASGRPPGVCTRRLVGSNPLLFARIFSF